jgi:hypothetical protein
MSKNSTQKPKNVGYFHVPRLLWRTLACTLAFLAKRLDDCHLGRDFVIAQALFPPVSNYAHFRIPLENSIKPPAYGV